MSLTPAGCEPSPSARSSFEGAGFGLCEEPARCARSGAAGWHSPSRLSSRVFSAPAGPARLLFLAEVAGMGWAPLVPAQRGGEVTAGPRGML